MLNIFDVYRTSKAAETEGVWCEFPKDVRLKIGRTTNPRYQELMREMHRVHGKRLRDNRMPPDQAQALMCDVAAQGLVFDWSGVLDENGKTVPYSSDVMAQALRDQPDLLERVLEYAKDYTTFAVEEEVEQRKNSAPDSFGN